MYSEWRSSIVIVFVCCMSKKTRSQWEFNLEYIEKHRAACSIAFDKHLSGTDTWYINISLGIYLLGVCCKITLLFTIRLTKWPMFPHNNGWCQTFIVLYTWHWRNEKKPTTCEHRPLFANGFGIVCSHLYVNAAVSKNKNWKTQMEYD